ncbi:hypothetical protein V1514DRAFT_219422 [Lipomyces japonicus]|uniref:uncharacterized protein n=1 Tax=Lipomyces japonicus TaxID=56871 RepID=UPI0034CE7EFA
MSPKVLLTGSSGFIAGHILQVLISRNYTIIATVRSQAKADYLAKIYPNAALSFVIVPDIVVADAFDEAVKGVDYVIHTASPFHFQVTDPVVDLLDPAVKGTKGILNAIQKYAPQVKKVIITSSFAAIVNAEKGSWPEHTYTEIDWNPVTWEQAINDGPSTTYRASKTFAEKAAWDFLEDNKPKFSITTINPPLVFGPMLHDVKPGTINTSNANIWNLINGSAKEILPTAIPVWVDVRNVAEAHVNAIDNPKTDNQRYFIVAGQFTFQNIANIVRKQFPEIKDKVPKGDPENSEPNNFFNVDNKKSIKDLGIEYISLEKSIVDLTKQLVDWVN